ncbi:MAG: hypothetical protein ACLVB1_07930 [Blautia obeum]
MRKCRWWHIDGRIVAKNGYLTVKKDFVGMPEAIEEVKKDYYIQVDMDEKLLDGKPQPPAFHEHMKLVLPSEDSQKPDAEAPQAEDAPIEVVGTWTDEHIQAVRSLRRTHSGNTH